MGRWGPSGLALAAALAGAGCPEPEDLCPVQLSFVPPGGAEVGAVEARFGPETVRLARQPGGWFGAALELRPGDHLYRLVVDGEPRLDPRTPLSLFDEDGVERSLLRVDDCRLPGWVVSRAEGSTEEGGRLVVELGLVPGLGGSPLAPASVEAALGDGSPVETVHLGGGRVRLAASGLGRGKHRLVVHGRDQEGRAAPELLVPVWVEDEPFDWQGALVYQVVVDRFALSGAPLDAGLPRAEAIRRRHGGDLRGLAEVVRSGYFEELGARALWVSPLYDNPEGLFPGNDGRDYAGYHGYWPVDPRSVEPVLGGEAALAELVAELHGRGMRLVVDVVPNHVHLEHPYHAEHLDEGWFNGRGECVCGVTCSWVADLERCWFTPYLADLDFRNAAVVGQVTADTLHWLEAYDLDGLRVDAVPMMPRLAVRHLADAVSRRLERGPTRVHLLGETYTGPDGWRTIAQYIGPFGLDGQFDFPVLWQARAVLAEGTSSMVALDRTVRESERTWQGSGSVMSPIVGNHDVPRLLTVAAGRVGDPFESPPAAPDSDEPYERALLAHALLLTLPGAPILYYGDEIGMPGAGDPDNRRPMRFGAELSAREARLLEAVRRLGRARAGSAALRLGSRRTLLATDDEYAFLRDAGDGRPAVVLIGRADETRRVSVDLPLDLVLEADRFVDVLGRGEARVVDGSLGPVDLPPRTAMVWLVR